MTSKAGLLRLQKGVRKVKQQNRVKSAVDAFKSVVNIPPKDSGAFLDGFPKDLETAKEKEGARARAAARSGQQIALRTTSLRSAGTRATASAS